MSAAVSNDGAALAVVLGSVLAERRRAVGLVPKDLAGRAYLSAGYMHSLERGARRPSLATFILLARALGLDPRDLLELLLQKMQYGRGAPPVESTLG